MNQRFYCPLPWMHLHVNKRGDYKICCIAETSESKLLDEKGSVIKANLGKSPKEIFNSPTLKGVRRSFLEGEWPKQCRRCKDEEINNCISRRQVELNYRDEQIQDLLDHTDRDGSLRKIHLKELDLRLGNKCNCACRMCSPQSSLKTFQHWNAVVSPELQISKEEEIKLRSIAWFDSKVFVESLQDKYDELEQIHFAGGESLISTTMPRILESMVNCGRASHISLSYNTNFSDFPESLWALWAKFKRVKFLISIDGVGELNEYIRLGCSWEKLEKNLLKLHEFCENHPQTEVIFFTVAQAYNVLGIKDLILYLKNYPHFVSVPHFTVIHEPSFLRLSVIPFSEREELKKHIEEAYHLCDGLLPEHYEYLRNNIKDILRSLEEDDTHLFSEFLNYTKKLDQIYSLSTEKNLSFLKKYF